MWCRVFFILCMGNCWDDLVVVMLCEWLEWLCGWISWCGVWLVCCVWCGMWLDFMWCS